jgi:hypothetical protein
LQIVLFDTERAWSYAMELKRESRSSGDVRKKHHLIKRLKKAARCAEHLEKLCSRDSNKVDTKTVFDAQVSMDILFISSILYIFFIQNLTSLLYRLILP